MSSEAVGWVFRHSPYSGAAFAVHLAVADSCNDQHDDEFWMRQGKLAVKARTTRKTVNEVLARMVTDGALKLLESGEGTNKYRLVMAENAALVFDRRTSTGKPDPVTRGARVAPDVAPPATSGDTEGVTTGDTEDKLLDPKGTQVERAADAALLVSWKVPKIVEDGGRLAEAVELCDRMAKLLRDRGHRVTAETSRSKGWVEPMEALLRLDGREPSDVARVLRWLDRGGDDVSAFWRVNVLSPNKLRLHWDRMREQYQRAVGPRPSKTAAALGAGTGPLLSDVLAGNKHQAIEGSARG